MPAPHAIALPGLRTEETADAPNIIGGYVGNSVTSGVVGATIGGGGMPEDGIELPDNNRVTDDFGTVAGGRSNRAGNDLGATDDSTGGTIGGGWQNIASDHATTVSGGANNTASFLYAAVGGGSHNLAAEHSAAVIGGWYNSATGPLSSVGGGDHNTATGYGAVVGGGGSNVASGAHAAVPGGNSNVAGGFYSFAGGTQAKVRDGNPLSPYYSGDGDGDEGTFVWADTSVGAFQSTGPNQFLIRSADGVGIGTNSPDPAAQLDVAGRIEMDGFRLSAGPGTGLVLKSDATGIETWQPESDPQVGTIGTNYLSKWDGTALTQSVVFESGPNIGIGTASPTQRLDVAGTIEMDGFKLGGATVAGRVLTTDGAGVGTWQSESDPQVGANSSNYLSKWDGSALISSIVVYEAANRIGIGTIFPNNKLTVSGDADINGNLGIGNSAPNTRLDVEQNNATVATFNRAGGDGRVITIERDGADQGGIQVNLGVVSISPFTGSHFAWSDRSPEKGTVVVMTGENRRLHDSSGGEPLYGIEPASKANDPHCLGAFLDLNEPGRPASSSNPHLVMAVGNGEMWVVDTGRDIQPGDYLISSDAVGHAMLDDEAQFPVGHVIAKASERVKWASVKDTVDGRKHKRISVLFESFDRGSAEFERRLQETNRRLEEQNRMLEERLLAVGRALAQLGPAK